MGAVREGPPAFFRLSPADREAGKGFVVRRGDARARLDVNFHALDALVKARLARSLHPVVPIGEIETRLQYGCSKLASIEPVGLPIVRMSNMQPDGWDWTGLKYVELSEKEAAAYRLQNGDILFNRTNSKELVGKCEVFAEPGEWVFASYLMRLAVDRTRALPAFVAAYLSGPSGRAQIERDSRQIIGMTNINAEEIRALRVPLPVDLDEQAALLARLDAARAERDARLAAAEAALAGLDAFLLGELGLTLPPEPPLLPYAARLGQLSEGRLDPFINKPWYGKLLAELKNVDHVPLGTIVGPIVGGATPSRSDASLYAEDGIALLRINNIRPNEIDLTDCRFITEHVHSGELARSQIVRDDVLLTITGRVGTAAVYDRDAPANINQHIVRLRLSSARVGGRYLAAFLNSSFGMAVSNRSVTGATRDALDYGSIRAIPIPTPSLKVQTAIIAELDRRRDEARRLRADAQAGWAAARRAFEDALLEPAAS